MITDRFRLSSLLPLFRGNLSRGLLRSGSRPAVLLAMALMVSGCSSVGGAWDSMFGSDGGSSHGASSSASAPVDTTVDGLIAPSDRPGYATGKGRKEPTTARALTEPKPKAQPEARTAPAAEPAPAPVPAPAPEPVPAPAPAPVAEPAPAPVPLTPEPTPVAPAPLMGSMMGSPYGDDTVVIGGDGRTYAHSASALPDDGFDPLAAISGGAGQLVATIQFANGSSVLSGVDQSIRRLVAALQKQRGAKVRVIGHASGRTGDMDFARQQAVNLEVSLRRADAVAQALAGYGVPRRSISTAAAGAADPVYVESMPSGEAGNRRTEIYLDY